jgi:putative membrane protein
MTKKLSFALAIVAITWTIQSCTEERGNSYTSKTKVNAEGLKFIKTAHEAGLTEIEASKIAKAKSANSQVKSFADMMITDHTEMAKYVDSLAKDKFVMVLSNVSHDHQIVLDSLAKKSGAEFDKAYMEMMVADHEEATELFNENEKSNYSAVRKVAFRWSSILENHLKEAKQVQATLK